MIADESVLVQLARMEVMLANILERVTDHGSRLDKAEAHISANALAIQRLADNAAAAQLTVEATAKALKEADEARRDKSEQSWTPFQRVVTLITVVTAIAAVGISLLT